MKKIVCILVVVAAVLGLGISQARGQTSFLLGLGAGALLFGGDGQNGASAATILYTAPRVNERVTDPLAKGKIIPLDKLPPLEKKK